MKYLLIMFMVGCFSAMATMSLEVGQSRYCCDTTDNATASNCRFESYGLSTDSAMVRVEYDEVHVLSAGEQTSMDAIIADAVTETEAAM